MKPAQFFASFKEGPLLPLYFFYGEERYLQDHAVTLIRRRASEETNQNVPLEIFSASSTPLPTVIAHARTVPLFGKRRIILLKESEKIPSKGQDPLRDFLRSPSTKTIIIFTGRTISLEGQIRQVASKQGMVRELKHPYPEEVPEWAQFLARERGRSIEASAATLISGLVGNNLQTLANEIEKLCLFAGEKKKITSEDVELVISPVRVDTVFALTDHIGNRNLAESYLVLSQLLQSGEPSLKVLAMISRHFRLIRELCFCLEQKMRPEEIARHLKVQAFVWKKLLPQAQKFSLPQLERCFRRLWETDLALKSQQVRHKIILEQLIADLCTL